MLKYGFSGQCIKRSTSGFRAAPVLLPENTFVPQKETPKGFFLFSLFHHLHDLAAAAGDHIPGLDMEQLVADGAVDIAFLLRPDNGIECTFQFVFHRVFLLK